MAGMLFDYLAAVRKARAGDDSELRAFDASGDLPESAHSMRDERPSPVGVTRKRDKPTDGEQKSLL